MDNEVFFLGKGDDYDRAVFGVLRDLSGKLEVHGLDLETVVWASDSSCPDQPSFVRFGRLAVRKELKGKLTPEEWKPQLASALIYDQRFRMKRRLGRLFYLSSSIFLSAASIWILFEVIYRVLPADLGASGRGYGYLLLLFSLVMFLFVAKATAPLMKRLRLRADQVAVEELGIGADLLAVLKKSSVFISVQE